MLFSSLTFLFYFLPIVILGHYLMPKRLQNAFLLLASLIFYAWGDARQVPLFSVLLLGNWGMGLLIDRMQTPRARKLMLTAGILMDFGALVFYKYIGFLLGIFGVTTGFFAEITLPLGISFFTFQAAAYLVDVYRRQTPPEKSFINFGAFLFLYPQLIAGPIIRYSDMAAALHSKRRPSAKQLESGMALLVAGLASKVLLANPLGEAFETLVALAPGQDTLCAWIALASCVMQVYFDFMGYSVMAVGLGRMMGFEFMRNFDFPLIARSITEFWRRWHITLTIWFRDYVYFPLGGSRKGAVRTIFNLMVVWGLTGLWHGASWNYLLWGLWYFAFIVAEKYTVKLRARLPGFVQHGVTIVAILLGWVLIVNESMAGYLPYMRTLFTFQISAECMFYLREYAIVLILGVLFSVPKVIGGLKALCRKYAWLRVIAVMGTLLLCIASLVKSSYNPFIYFRF